MLSWFTHNLIPFAFRHEIDGDFDGDNVVDIHEQFGPNARLARISMSYTSNWRKKKNGPQVIVKIDATKPIKLNVDGVLRFDNIPVKRLDFSDHTGYQQDVIVVLMIPKEDDPYTKA